MLWLFVGPTRVYLLDFFVLFTVESLSLLCLIFIPRHTLVSGYYVIPFGVCPSVRPSVRPSVLTISDG